MNCRRQKYASENSELDDSIKMDNVMEFKLSVVIYGSKVTVRNP
jgi:hypothetical protein